MIEWLKASISFFIAIDTENADSDIENFQYLAWRIKWIQSQRKILVCWLSFWLQSYYFCCFRRWFFPADEIGGKPGCMPSFKFWHLLSAVWLQSGEIPASFKSDRIILTRKTQNHGIKYCLHWLLLDSLWFRSLQAWMPVFTGHRHSVCRSM